MSDPYRPVCLVPKFEPDARGGIQVLNTGTADAAGPRWTLFAAGDWANIRIHADAAARTPEALYGDRLAADIRSADLAMVNLECVLGGSTPIPKDGPNLQGDPAAAAALKSAGFDLACLGNNHISDFGAEGVRDTLHACSAAGLPTCGAGMNLQEAARPALREVQGVRVGVLNFADSEEGPATQWQAGYAPLGAMHTRERVRDLRREADVVVLVVHGGREYAPVPPPYWRNHVLAAASAGADLVIGHHPHVPQGMTLLETPAGNVPVIFSTGNFVFRPAETDPGLIPPRTQDGYAVQAEFAGAKLAGLTLIPYEIQGEDGPRAVGPEGTPKALRLLEALSAPLADDAEVETWFDALSDHFWTRQVCERLRGLTPDACNGDLGRMKHAYSHHANEAHTSLISRAMRRCLDGTAETAPAEIRETLRQWFSGEWPA